MLLGLVALVVAVLVLFALSRRLQTVVQLLGQLWLGDPERAQQLFYFAVAPGIVVHELAHAAMALVLQVEVYSIDLFTPGEGRQLGAVQHAQTDMVRGILIGTAPVWAAGAILAVLFTVSGVQLPAFGATLAPWTVVLGSIGAILELFHQAGPLRGILLFYVFFALGNAVLLSPQDLTDLRPLAVALALSGVLVFAASTAIDLSKLTFLVPVGQQLAVWLNTVLFFLIAVILADLLAVAPLHILHAVVERRLHPR